MESIKSRTASKGDEDIVKMIARITGQSIMTAKGSTINFKNK